MMRPVHRPLPAPCTRPYAVAGPSSGIQRIVRHAALAIACIAAGGVRAPVAPAADATAAAGPAVVAILHPPDEDALAGAAALVQAMCGDLPGVVLVERTEIDKVVAEQQLTDVLSAEAAAGRTALGRLLKADLLVILASGRTKEGGVDPVAPVQLVICETSRGLRLAVQDMDAIEGEAEVAAVTDLVHRAVNRRSRPITEIVAVPPFVSNDLDIAQQSLQRPYAIVAEQVLLEQLGVLVVELAEARAIADEQALTGGDDVARSLPLFLFGEFRHHEIVKPDTDDAATLTLQLSISRGRQEIARREIAGVSRATAAAAIRKATADLIGQAAGQAARAPDPKADAKQLADRANQMFRLGSWREALELAEAALLLQGDDVGLHKLAMRALQHEHDRILRAFDERIQAEFSHLPPLEREMALERDSANRAERRAELSAKRAPRLLRGREHLEYVLRNKKIVVSEDFFPYAEFMAGGKEQLRDMFLLALRDKYERKVFDHTSIIIDQFLCSGCTDLTAEQRRRWGLGAVEFLPVGADAEGQARVLALLFGHGPTQPEDRAFAKACIPVLRGYDNVACKATADTLERRLASGAESLLTDASLKPVEQPAPTRPTRVEIRFEKFGIAGELSGWMPVAPAIDVVWEREFLHLLVVDRGRRILRPVSQILGGSLGVVPNTCVCFDGRLVWAFQNPGHLGNLRGLDRPANAPRLVAFDPGGDRAWTVSTADGLPALPLSHVSITPLGVGKVCVIGHVTQEGRARVWFAMVTLDTETERAAVNVFHESRDVADAAGGKEVDRGFGHSHAYTIMDPNGGGKRRVIACVGQTFVIDPEKPGLAKAGFEVRQMPDTLVMVHDGTMHWVWNTAVGTFNLFSLGVTDKAPRRSTFTMPWGCMAHWQNRWVLVDRKLRFHATDRLDAPWKPLVTDLAYPEGEKIWTQGLYLFRSSHYGLVMHDLVKRTAFRVVDATREPPDATFPPGRAIAPADDITLPAKP